MANKFDFNRANKNTKNEAGWCQRWMEQGFGFNGVYPNAWTAWTKVPKKRGGLPPSDGNYYPIYFDGWWRGNHYADVALYRNGKVWSGSDPKWRSGTTFDTYKRWIGTAYLGWSEYLGTKKVATIPTPKPKPKYAKYKVNVKAANFREKPTTAKGSDVTSTRKEGYTFEVRRFVTGQEVNGSTKWAESVKNKRYMHSSLIKKVKIRR